MATSKLQRITGNRLDAAFPNLRVRENYRPDWLISSSYSKLELDFYIEELNIAFEVQGMQHFSFIPYFFRTEDEFKKRQKYDQEKRDLCRGRGVKLYQILTETDVMIAIAHIKTTYLFQESVPRYANEEAKEAYELEEQRLIDERQLCNKKRNQELVKRLGNKKTRRRISQNNYKKNQSQMTDFDRKMQELCSYHEIAGKFLRKGKPLDFEFKPTFLSQDMVNDLSKHLKGCKNISEIRYVFAIRENQIIDSK